MSTYVLEQIDQVSTQRAEGGHASVTLHLRDGHTGERIVVQGLPYDYDRDLQLGATYSITFARNPPS